MLLIKILGFVSASLLTAIYIFQLHINTSTSMPLGIYRTVSQPIVSNSLVAVCLPFSLAQFGKQRGYLGSGSCLGNTQPVLKKIVAVAGDEVDVTKQGVVINNKLLPHSKALSFDDRLRPLASQVNTHKKLTAKEIWLYGTTSNKSWDSRYYGAVECSQVRAVVIPMWIWFKR